MLLPGALFSAGGATAGGDAAPCWDCACCSSLASGLAGGAKPSRRPPLPFRRRRQILGSRASDLA
jgi:hypothetical protein